MPRRARRLRTKSLDREGRGRADRDAAVAAGRREAGGVGLLFVCRFRCDPSSAQTDSPVASGFKSPLTGEAEPPGTCSPGPLRRPRGPTSPQAGRQPCPFYVLQAPPSRGKQGLWEALEGSLPRGSGCLPPGVPANVPCDPAALPPAGGGRAHLCEHEAGSPHEKFSASCARPRPHFHEQLGTQSTPVSPLRSDFCLLGWSSSLSYAVQHPVILRSRGFRFSKSVCEAGACPLEKASGGD